MLDLKNPSNAFSCNSVFGPLISSFFCLISGFIPSNKIKSLFGVEKDKSLLVKNLSLPAYDQCLKASHIFNILDARGVISVAQRAEYISKIRELTKGVGSIWLSSQS